MKTQDPTDQPVLHVVDNDAELPAQPVDEIEDIDPAEWLAEDDSDITKKIVVMTKHGPRNLTIAALTNEEISGLQKVSRRLMIENGKKIVKFDGDYFKDIVVAKSLGKVAKSQFTADHFRKKLGGTVVTIADEITKLSGFDGGKGSETDQLVGFSS